MLQTHTYLVSDGGDIWKQAISKDCSSGSCQNKSCKNQYIKDLACETLISHILPFKKGRYVRDENIQDITGALFCFAFVGVVDDCCLSSSISVSPVKIEEVISGADDTFYITVTNPELKVFRWMLQGITADAGWFDTLGNKPDVFPDEYLS